LGGTEADVVQTNLQHPLSSSRLGTLVSLVSHYGCEPRYLPRLSVAVLVCLLRQPAMWLESVRYSKQIRNQSIDPAPVFIIGHWRSGTTHLQNLLAQDRQFGRVTLLQAAMPNDFLTMTQLLEKTLSKALPETRLMDNVPVYGNAPWEEEMALASMGRLSFYHVSFFPRHLGQIFREAVLLNDGDPETTAEWRRQYLNFVAKIQLIQPGRRLLLKNPANTARIRLIKKIFPAARFIHIHRDPYKVFASTVHLYLKAQHAWGLQRPVRKHVVEHVLRSYKLLMDAYLADREILGSGELVEISFRQLQQDPLGTLENIYQSIGLEGFESNRHRFASHLHSQRNYRKNRLEISPLESQLVNQHWNTCFEQFNYTVND
jgi:hypothetical protein